MAGLMVVPLPSWGRLLRRSAGVRRSRRHTRVPLPAKSVLGIPQAQPHSRLGFPETPNLLLIMHFAYAGLTSFLAGLTCRQKDSEIHTL